MNEVSKFSSLIISVERRIGEIAQNLRQSLAECLRSCFRQIVLDQSLLTEVHSCRLAVLREVEQKDALYVAAMKSDPDITKAEPLIKRIISEAGADDIGSWLGRCIGVTPSMELAQRVSSELSDAFDQTTRAKRVMADALFQAISVGRFLNWSKWYLLATPRRANESRPLRRSSTDYGLMRTSPRPVPPVISEEIRLNREIPRVPEFNTISGIHICNCSQYRGVDSNGIQEEQPCDLELCMERVQKSVDGERMSLVHAIAIAEAREAKDRKKYGADETTIAAAAAHFGKTRNHAERIKPALRRQLRTLAQCPYCEGPIEKDARADHIYPVVKGGLSTQENMVYVCLTCNQRKSDLTLREFIALMSFDRERVESRLTKLGKAF